MKSFPADIVRDAKIKSAAGCQREKHSFLYSVYSVLGSPALQRKKQRVPCTLCSCSCVCRAGAPENPPSSSGTGKSSGTDISTAGHRTDNMCNICFSAAPASQQVLDSFSYFVQAVHKHTAQPQRPPTLQPEVCPVTSLVPFCHWGCCLGFQQGPGDYPGSSRASGVSQSPRSPANCFLGKKDPFFKTGWYYCKTMKSCQEK